MNRIRAIRERRGLTQEQLGELVGTTSQQIGRLESEKRELTVDWMNRIARALNCHPMDLVAVAIVAEMEDEVVEATSSEVESVRKALLEREIHTYEVKGDSLEIVLPVGTVIAVDETITDFEKIESGQVVLIRLAEAGGEKSVKVLRVYIRPGLLTTNRAHGNAALRVDDELFEIQLLGRVES